MPFFFLQSGYLFFSNYSGEWTNLLDKWKRRGESLLLPFLAWSSLAMLIVSLVGRRAPWEWGTAKALNAWLGITSPMLLFHLWFLRDLMVFIVLAPVLWFFAKRAPLLMLSLLFILHVVGPWQFPWPSSLGLWYFFLGTVLAVRKWGGEGLDSYGRWWIGIYVLLAFVDSLDSGHSWSRGLHELGLLVGCGACWVWAGRWERSGGVWVQWLERLAPASFFLYLAHEPLLRYLRYGLHDILPKNPIGESYLLYGIPAVCAILICTALYFNVMQRFALLRRAFCGGR